MQCILCGLNEEYEKGICKNCIVERLSVSVSGTLDLTECPKCGSLKIGKKWYPDNQEKILARKALQFISVNDPSFSISAETEDVMVSHDGTSTFVRAMLSKHDFPQTRTDVNIPTRRLRNSCPTCNKVTGSYYEAILQLRTLEAEHTALVDNVKDETIGIMKVLNKKDPESFVSTVNEVPEGLDIYLGKRSDGTKLSKHIMDHYLASMKVSKTLAGIRDGTKFYRFTYGVRLASLEKGSVISMNGKDYMVLNSGPVGLEVIDTKSERISRISRSEFFSSDVRVIEKNPRKTTFVVVSKEGNELQLMDKNTFNIITMKGDTDREEVELFSFDGKYFLPGRA